MAKLSPNQKAAVQVLTDLLATGPFPYADASAWKAAAQKVTPQPTITVKSLVKEEAVEEVTIPISARMVKVYRPKA